MKVMSTKFPEDKNLMKTCRSLLHVNQFWGGHSGVWEAGLPGFGLISFQL